jgi:hypothetical protein
MRKIFICYRRADAEYAAGALGRELRRHFGEEQVFRDKEDIAGGEAWKQKVLNAIDRDSALLVLIARDWSEARDVSGKRRIDDPGDPIRMELHDGIRDGATIIPVLLENAAMPTAEQLPPDLAPLAEYNALRLHDTDWQYNLDRIITTLEKAGFTPVAPRQPVRPEPREPESPRGWSAKAIVAGVLLAITFLGLAAGDTSRDDYFGAAALSLGALVLGILAWKETAARARKGYLLAVIVTVLASVTLLGSLGNLGSDTPERQADGSDPTPLPEPEREPERKADDGDAAEVAAMHDEAMKAIRNIRADGPPARVPAPQAAPEGAAVPALADISGRWHEEDGGILEFTQQGEAVHMVGLSDGVPIEGVGRVAGRRLRMTVNMAGLLSFEMTLDLSADGRRLAGKMHAPTGEADVVLTR